MNFPKNVYKEYSEIYHNPYFKISEDRFKNEKPYELIDISLKGFSEHKAFQKNFKKYFSITKRGLSFLRKISKKTKGGPKEKSKGVPYDFLKISKNEKISKNGENSKNEVINEMEVKLHILRKGLPKFFELNLKNLRKNFEFVFFGFESEKLKINFYEKKMDLFITKKLNGLNIQLSYDEFLGKFIIGSKNVTITANFFSEIEKEDFFDKIHILKICEILLKIINFLNFEKKNELKNF